jgi:hypothetical protein
VWDGQGLPECTLDLGVEPVSVEGQALPVLRAEQDADPDAPGFQLEVTITAGRPDMTVSLFSLDPSTGEQEVREEESGDDLGAVFALTVGDGERSLRAVCEWAPEALRPSSPTVRLLVDTEGPDCALVQPASRVRAADDLDPETEGVQVELVGRSTAPDVVGQPGRFTFEGTEIAGSPIDEAGETSATATLTVEPGVAQTFTFAVADPAGNLCEASATFE